MRISHRHFKAAHWLAQFDPRNHVTVYIWRRTVPTSGDRMSHRHFKGRVKGQKCDSAGPGSSTDPRDAPTKHLFWGEIPANYKTGVNTKFKLCAEKSDKEFHRDFKDRPTTKRGPSFPTVK